MVYGNSSANKINFSGNVDSRFMGRRAVSGRECAQGEISRRAASGERLTAGYAFHFARFVCPAVVFIRFVAFARHREQRQRRASEVTIGTIEKIEPEAKIVTLRSHDDLVHVFKWTGKTVAHGVKEAAVWTGHEAHVDTNVAIQRVKVGGVDTVKAIK
jgi:Cu/Ag efflux protein CusF